MFSRSLWWKSSAQNEVKSYSLRTFSAAGPLGPLTTSKLTRSPSESDLKPSPWIAEWCTNTSSPPSCSIKPNPFESLNHLTFPSGFLILLMSWVYSSIHLQCWVWPNSSWKSKIIHYLLSGIDFHLKWSSFHNFAGLLITGRRWCSVTSRAYGLHFVVVCYWMKLTHKINIHFYL